MNFFSWDDLPYFVKIVISKLLSNEQLLQPSTQLLEQLVMNNVAGNLKEKIHFVEALKMALFLFARDFAKNETVLSVPQEKLLVSLLEPLVCLHRDLTLRHVWPLMQSMDSPQNKDFCQATY